MTSASSHYQPMPIPGKVFLLVFLLAGILLAVLSEIGWQEILHNGDGSLSEGDWQVVNLLGFGAASFLVAFPAWVWLAGLKQSRAEGGSPPGASAGSNTSTTVTSNAAAPSVRYVQIGRKSSVIAVVVLVGGLAVLRKGGIVDFFAAGALFSVVGPGVGRLFARLVERPLLATGAEVTASNADGVSKQALRPSEESPMQKKQE
jgi:hypothetical protein